MSITLSPDKIYQPKRGQLFKGYDAMSHISERSPHFYGFSTCYEVSKQNDYVVLELTISSPFGSYKKTFKINDNINFEWQPFGRFKIAIDISNYNKQYDGFNFELKSKFFVSVSNGGWKCQYFSTYFSIPQTCEAIDSLSDADYISSIALHAVRSNERNSNEEPNYYQ